MEGYFDIDGSVILSEELLEEEEWFMVSEECMLFYK